MTVVSGFELFGGGGIKSVQNGYVDLLSLGAITNFTQPISAVDPQKSFVLISLYPFTVGQNMWRAGLIDGETIQFLREVGSTNPRHLIWQVIELENGIVHRGNFTRIASQMDGYQLPIPAVDLSKSFSIISASSNNNTSYGLPIARLISEDTLQFYAASQTGNFYVEWQVVQMG